MLATKNQFTVQEASEWASEYLNKEITPSNISYLIQYGRIKKIKKQNGTLVSKDDLIKYYGPQNGSEEEKWKKELGEDLNWTLSFENYREKERTKHVHRLHPYKGKFIPQLVEYFLDQHTDEFKKEVFFKPGDLVLDPFCGSGTTLVQANELGIHAVGIDVSEFNALISNIKTGKHDTKALVTETRKITNALQKFVQESETGKFENELTNALTAFNNEYFPSPDFRYKVRQGEINQFQYGAEKIKEFLPTYQKLVEKYDIQIKQKKSENFLDTWYLEPVRKEIDFVASLIEKIENQEVKKLASLILSRTIRSCRATTHADLGTLMEPVYEPYYCRKHGKVCKPLFSSLRWWKRYSGDTFNRISDFAKLRTNTMQHCLVGDSRKIDILRELQKKDRDFAHLLFKNKFRGIFSSPPYVGLINYHEQHAYAYDLFGFERKDELEIGPLFKGQGQEARNSYKEGISKVLINNKRFLQDNYDVFLVANDKYGMYPDIADMAGMKIVNQYKRPVMKRVEKNRMAYSEIIFHLKEK